MRVLITGVSGFAGRHLAALLARRHELALHGLIRSQSLATQLQALAPGIQLHQCDLLDEAAIRSVLWLVEPEQIFHLAAYANPSRSFQEARQAWDANLTASLNLYDACVSTLKHKPRILHVSTGAVYGEGQTNDPITESSPFRPNNPYAASKAAAEIAAYQFFVTHQLPMVIARPFNQTGPGQSVQFALARFAEQLSLMELGRIPPVLRVGNLRSERDFTDIRDMARAYELLMLHGKPGEAYTIASGTVRPMSWFLDRLLKLVNIPVSVERDEQFLRPVETRTLRVNCDKLRQTTDWQPQTPIAQTLADLLHFYRARITREPTTSREN